MKTEGEHYSHFVRRDEVEEALRKQYAIETLCKIMWIPRPNASELELCPKCKQFNTI